MPHFNIITPLDITLFHVIQAGSRAIATDLAIVVVILTMLIVSDQLRRVNSGVIAQTRIPGLDVILVFITATRITPGTLIVVCICGVAVAAEETREIVVKLMLYSAPKQLIAIAVAIAVIAVG